MILRQRQPRIEDANHLKWIRTLPCLVTGSTRNIQAAHIRYGDRRYNKRPTGMGEKPSDIWTVPLAEKIHGEQHTRGEETWWWSIGIDPLAVAAELYQISGNTTTAIEILKAYR